MAIKCPFAQWRPLSDQQTESRMTSHDIVCIHTMVGYLRSTDTMFGKNGYGGTESHFGIGGIWGSDRNDPPLDGHLMQWQDLAFQADANLDGNPRTISIETADNAPKNAADIARWTPAQVETIVRLIRWLCSTKAHAACPPSWKCHNEGIPMTLIPDTKPGRRGLALHRQGCKHSNGYGVKGVAGVQFLVEGGEKWSSSTGKECPCDERVEQFVNEIIPALNVVTPAPDNSTTEGEETAMALSDDAVKQIEQAFFRVLTQPVDAAGKPRFAITWDGEQDPNIRRRSVGGMLTVLGRRSALTSEIRSALGGIAAQLTTLARTSADGATSAEVARVGEQVAALLAMVDDLDGEISHGAEDLPSKTIRVGNGG